MSTQFIYPPGEPIILAERVFDAPRDLVWEAFTRPEHIARWWGPRRYRSTVLEHEFRVGGKWRIVHEGAEGERHEFFGEILEIDAPTRVAQTFCYLNFPPVHENFDLTEEGRRTRFCAVMRFDSIASRDGMAASGMEGGASESYERLDELLAEIAKQPA